MSEYLEKRKKTNKFWLAWSLIEGLVVLAAGILAIVAGVRNESTSGNIDTILGYAISSFVVLDGIFRVVMYFIRFEKGVEITPLIVAGFEVAMGSLLIFIQTKYAGLLIESLVAFISIALMVMGVLLLVNSIFQITRLHEKLVMPIAAIVLAAILIGVGIAIMILSFSQDHHNTITMIMTGSTLAIIGASLFILGVFASKKDKKEIEKFEAEEAGDYDLAGEKRKKVKKTNRIPEEPVAVQPAEVIEEAEVVEEAHHDQLPRYEEPHKLSGPRALNHNDNED